MVLRGYDRIEVDAYIEKLLEENSTLRRELDSGAARAAAERPAERAAAQEQPPQQYDIDTPAEDSFGFRAEKLLRLAEREAAEMRTRATRDAETVEATARQRAEEQLRSAEQEADQMRAQASQEAGRLKKQATQDAARVNYLHRSTKDELRRLASLLNAELDRPDPADAPPPVAEAGDDQGTARLDPDNESSGTAASNH
jgi:cell division septum initiation protein DivIVA